jgi:hypothetical protein
MISVSKMTSYGLDDKGSIPGRSTDSYLRRRVLIGSGAHPASCPMGATGYFPEGKQPKREANHSLPFAAVVKNAWSFTFSPPYAFVAWCLTL